MGYLPIPAESVADGVYFIIQARDGSMAGAEIPQGSNVLIRQQREVGEHDIAFVAVAAEEAQLRYMQRLGDQMILTAAAPGYLPRVVPLSTVHVIGLATEVITHKSLRGR